MCILEVLRILVKRNEKNITIPGDIVKAEHLNIQAYESAVLKTYSIGQSARDFRISCVSSLERFFT